VKQSKMHPKNRLERVLENIENGRAYSPYVHEFAKSPLCGIIRASVHFESWKKKSSFVKEIEEAYACLYRVKEILRKRDRRRDSTTGSASSSNEDDSIRFVELCSGKGFLSVLLSFEYPRARIDMVDISETIDLTHLRAKEANHITFHRLDLKSESMCQIIDGACANGEFVFLVGVHLCGDLARMSIELFRRAYLTNRNHTALVLSPCCLPQRRRFLGLSSHSMSCLSASMIFFLSLCPRIRVKIFSLRTLSCIINRHDCFGFHVKDQAKTLGIHNYKLWCIFLNLEMRTGLNSWNRQQSGIHMMQDDNMLDSGNSGAEKDVKNMFLCCLCSSDPSNEQNCDKNENDCDRKSEDNGRIVASILNASKWKVVANTKIITEESCS
jgi:hypothetical protein